jgi:serine/threonine protein kinase
MGTRDRPDLPDMNADADGPSDRTPPEDRYADDTVRGRPPRHRSGTTTTQVRVDSAATSTIPADLAGESGRAGLWHPGARIDRYELIHPIGSGGMSVVWSARDVDLGREVAIKLSPPELRAWLLGEARAMARLHHPNVVGVYEVGETEGGLFIAMERIDGGTLSEWLSASARPWPDVVAVFIAAGRGLAEAHRAGLVHRDFKPDNVLVGADGVARLSDFGLAVAASETAPVEPPATGPHRALTEEGTLVGTPAYMSPEQLLGQQLTARSDQFSFCLALYEALHGAMPFDVAAGETVAGFLLAASVDGGGAPPAFNLTLPYPLHRAVLRGLACEPAERWPSMDALLAELERCTAHGRA